MLFRRTYIHGLWIHRFGPQTHYQHSGRPAGNGDVASVAPGENRTVIPHPGSGRTVVGIMLISMSGHPCGFGGSVAVPSGLL